VRQVLPRVEFSGLISNGDKSTVMMAWGVEPDSEFAVKGPFLTITAGTGAGGDSQAAEVMLGEGLAAA
jgi:putative ABC transport system permease protein